MKSTIKIITILGVAMILVGGSPILYNKKIERTTNRVLNNSKVLIESRNYIKAMKNIAIVKRYDKKVSDNTNKNTSDNTNKNVNINENINNGFLEYLGIGRELTIYNRESKALGNYKVMVNYYDPKRITNKSFVDYYENEAYPKLGKNGIFDLIDIDKQGYGFIFCGNGKNEVDDFDNMLMKNEFTKGEMGSNGDLDGYDSNSQYGAMVGDKQYVFSNTRGGKGKLSFDF